jgi:hypothetical protein
MRTVGGHRRLAAGAPGTLSSVASRLVLALIVSLRAVLVYGEAASCHRPARWRDLVPARLRLPARRPAGSAAPASAAVEL